MKRCHHYTFAATLFMMVSFTPVNAQEWLPLKEHEKVPTTTMTVLEDSPQAYRVKVIVNGIHDTEVKEGDTAFHRLSLDTGGTLLSPGEPALPLINLLLAIPSDSEPSVTVSEAKWDDIKTGTIWPSQASPAMGNKPGEFLFDSDIYNSDFLPAIVTLGEEQVWRGIRNVGVCVCPFKYQPQEGMLSVMSEFILNVDFTPKSRSMTHMACRTDDETAGLFDNSVFMSQELLPECQKAAGTESYDYLIIVGNTPAILNSDKLVELKRWKELRGFRTRVESLSNIGSTWQSIKSFIDGEYSKNVRYVLLVGDYSAIPMPSLQGFYFTSQNIAGDYWYGCVDGPGDWQADIYVGRFSTNSLLEFSHMVDKTIKYESTCPSAENILLVSHKASANSYWGHQYWCNTIKNSNYVEPASFVTAYGASLAENGDNATNADVVAMVNQGVPLVCYLGYGQPGHWGGEYGQNGSGTPNSGWNASGENFTTSEVANMADSTCAVFFSISPNSGDISTNGNMLEDFTRPAHGAAAFVSSTTEFFYDLYNTYAYLAFQNLLNSGKYHVGLINVWSHILNILGYGNANMGKDYALSSVCGGDPALELWTDTPQDFGDVKISASGGNVAVTTDYTGDYEVNVVSEAGEFICTQSVLAGNTCTFTRPSGNFYVGVKKHNFLPHIIYFNVDAEAIQNVTFDHDAYYHNTPLLVGYGVTADWEDGEVVVKKGSKLIIKNGPGGVTFDYGFKCEKGAVLEVK